MADKGDMAIMFSGGVDSTLAAIRLIESGDCDRLHLLTFCNGFCVRVGSSSHHVAQLKRIYGEDRFVHKITYVTEIFEAIRSPLLDMVKEYKSTLVFDLCCRLSMESAAIVYALNNNISSILDGTNIDQGRLFLEKPDYMRVSKEFFASFGIDYFSPVYAPEGGREGRMAQLRDRGFSVGPTALEKLSISSSLFHQPFCLVGVHTFFFTSFMRNAPGFKQIVAKYNLSLEDAIKLRKERQVVARQLIEERTKPLEAGTERMEDRVCTTKLCGENGVEITLPPGTLIDLDKLASVHPSAQRKSPGCLVVKAGGVKMDVHREGHVLVSGTRDRQKAREAYDRDVAAHDAFMRSASNQS